MSYHVQLRDPSSYHSPIGKSNSSNEKGFSGLVTSLFTTFHYLRNSWIFVRRPSGRCTFRAEEQVAAPGVLVLPEMR